MSPRTDGNRMLADVHRLCGFGPRPAGSQASAAQRAELSGRFQALGFDVREQPFEATHPLTGELVAMTNLIAAWNGNQTRNRLLVGAHGDTRPFPDEETDPERLKGQFLGANDGASGLAVLLELARHVPTIAPDLGLDLVVFDGEELVYQEEGEYCLGSQHFAASLSRAESEGPAGSSYKAAVVVDMVGRTGLRLVQERFGHHYAPRLTQELWSVAASIGARAFENRVGRWIIDDHLPLLEAEIPAIVLIDLDDPRWHTMDDLPEYCSADSMSQVANVLCAWLARHATIRSD